jgi:hypothetical protein
LITDDNSMANPFFSGRIPQELLDRVEQHVQDTGESKTNVLIQALAAYLNFPIRLSSTNNSDLEKRVNDLEQQIVKLLNLDRDVDKIKQIIFNQNQGDNINIISDNNSPSIQPSCPESNDTNVIIYDNKEEKIVKDNNSSNREWQLIGEMRIAEILQLPGLESQNETWLKNKLRMLNSSKKEKITTVGSYQFKIIGKDAGSKGKIIYEVYDNSDN